jgi:hypothetical protein
MSAPSAAFKQFEKRISMLATLIAKIPVSIPVAKETDRINKIFQKIPIPDLNHADPDITVTSVFNRRMDILFSEDVHDTNGRLINILCGKYGMDLVVAYFSSSLATRDLTLGIAMVKLDRNTLPCPHIPYGIHMEWIYSMDSTWIPYGMDIFHGFHMDSIWNGYIPWIPHGFHMEYVSTYNLI